MEDDTNDDEINEFNPFADNLGNIESAAEFNPFENLSKGKDSNIDFNPSSEHSLQNNTELESDKISKPTTPDTEKNKTISEFATDEKKDGNDVKFAPNKKISASAAMKSGGKPNQLNKKFLLSTIIIGFGLVFLITFLMPTKAEKKKQSEKPIPSQSKLSNYESYATRPNENIDFFESNNNMKKSDTIETQSDVDANGNVIIPPVIPPKEETMKPVYTTQKKNEVAGGGSRSTRPDTRNDRLQGKAITGIKGLTSTQERYSTDYQATIEKNTAVASVDGYSMPPKEEYIKNVLSTYGGGQQNSYSMQNDQSGKNNFFGQGRGASNAGSGTWLGLNTIWQGTIFEAVLTSELNTDLPGEITARVAKNIYSSQDGRYLLIPQNSMLFGTYNSSISYSQSRVQVAWTMLIRPDGYQVHLGGMNGTDAQGASGIEGHVNDHPFAYLKAIALMSTVGIINGEFASSIADTDNEYVQNIMANSQSVTMELGEKLIDRAMNVQPTIKIKAGTKINIVANRNLTLPPVDLIPVTQPYHRQ